MEGFLIIAVGYLLLQSQLEGTAPEPELRAFQGTLAETLAPNQSQGVVSNKLGQRHDHLRYHLWVEVGGNS